MTAAIIALLAFIAATGWTARELLRGDRARYGRVWTGFAAMLLLALTFSGILDPAL